MLPGPLEEMITVGPPAIAISCEPLQVPDAESTPAVLLTERAALWPPFTVAPLVPLDVVTVAVSAVIEPLDDVATLQLALSVHVHETSRLYENVPPAATVALAPDIGSVNVQGVRNVTSME
jgi:hypothetical protein